MDADSEGEPSEVALEEAVAPSTEFCNSDVSFVAETDSVDEILARFEHFEGCDICEKYKHDKSEKTVTKLQNHIKAFHGSYSIAHKMDDGRTVFLLPCRNGCTDRSAVGARRSHYHCPFCGRTCGRRNRMLLHLSSRCSYIKYKNRTSSTALIKPRASGIKPIKQYPTSSNDAIVKAIMEKRLCEWLQEQHASGRVVDIATLQAKAKMLFERTRVDLGEPKGKAFIYGKSNVKSFMERYGMKDMKVVSFEKPSSVKSDAQKKDIILGVINEVQQKQALYDPLLAALEDGSDNTALWEEIAKNVGLESGDIAMKIWKNLERKYTERHQHGSRVTEYWQYEKHLQFLATTVTLEPVENGISGESQNESLSDLDANPMFTVAVEGGDLDYTEMENSNTQYPAISHRLLLAKLKKTQMQMDILRAEHHARMEVLSLEKNILQKKLENL